MQRRYTLRKARQQGFSLLELGIVASIMLILGALAVPKVMRVMAETRLRGSATEVAAFLQRARMSAIRNNRFVTVRFANLPNNGGNLVYADTWPTAVPSPAGDGSGNGQYDGTTPPPQNREPVIKLGSNVLFVQNGNPAFTANLITTAAPNFVSNDAPLRVTWSARGLPCVSNNGSTCSNPGQAPTAFAYFMNDGSPNDWAAITVSPSGRVKIWMWTGAAWQ
jgi:Tfp pilus assembly protein FimT